MAGEDAIEQNGEGQKANVLMSVKKGTQVVICLSLELVLRYFVLQS